MTDDNYYENVLIFNRKKPASNASFDLNREY